MGGGGYTERREERWGRSKTRSESAGTSLISSAISQFKGHHNYDGAKTVPAYVC